MAEKILIMGESGTGKSTSMRNLDPAITAIVNPVGKPLPFKGKFEKLNSVTDSGEIIEYMKKQVKAGKKVIVVDDFQYILSIPYMNRIKEAGWDKWNDFGANYFEIVDVCKELPDDVMVYYMTHTETLDNGITTIKLIGKLLREKITIEGLFTIVLRTSVIDGKYYFLTQNSGKDTVKSPMGMFPAYAIDNDLRYVDEKIRNYYEIGEFKSDEEMEQADKSVAAEDVTKEAATGRKRRGSRKKSDDTPEVETPKEDKTPDFMNIPEGADEEIPFDEVDKDKPEEEPKPKSRRRGKKSDVETKSDPPEGDDTEDADKLEEMTGAKAAFEKAKAKYGTDNETTSEGDTEEKSAGRRTRRTRNK